MRRYAAGEVDFFTVYSPLTRSIYVVPFDVMGAHGRLRIEPVLNGQRKFVRWAADFTWERHVEELRREERGGATILT